MVEDMRWLIFIVLLSCAPVLGLAATEPPCEQILKQDEAELCQNPDQNFRQLQSVGRAHSRFDWVKKQSLKLQVEIDRQVLRLGEMLRNERDGKSSEFGSEQARKLESKYEDLRKILQDVEATSKRQAFCAVSCAPGRNADLDQEYKQLQKKKIQLLSEEPLLLHPDVETSLRKPFSESIRRQALISSLSSHATQLSELSHAINKAVDDPQEPLGPARHNQPMVKFSNTLARNHSEVLEAVIGEGFPYDEPLANQNAWCFYKRDLDYINKRNLILSLGGEVALWGASTLINPPAAVVARLLRMGSESARWGLRFGQGLKALASEPFTAVKAEHALVTTSSRTEITRALTTSSPSRWSRNQSMVIYKIGEKEHLAISDLGRAVRFKDSEALQASRNYWDHVRNVYKDRLHLSDTEIKNFLKSSEEMKDRTILITSSETSPLIAKKFNGGTGIVLSRRAEDLLPLEKATGLRVDRSLGGVAEVTRLTAQNADAAELSKDLLLMTGEILKNERSINTVYVYTSKAHARLYKGMGVPIHREQLLENNRDVILTIRVFDLLPK